MPDAVQAYFPDQLPDYRCRVCGTPAALIISDRQAFCGDEDCPCLMFHPGRVDGGLSNAATVDLDRPVREAP